MPVLGAGCVVVSLCESRNETQLEELVGEFFPGAVHRASPGELAQVIAGAAPGDIVALEAGTYTGEFDVSGIALVGVCNGETLITGRVESTATGVLNATIGSSAVFDLSVSGEAIGIWAAGGASISLTNVEVDRARRVGVRVAGGAFAALDNVWVHDMRPSAEDDSFGRGIQVSNESSAVLVDVTIQRVRDVGLLSIGAGASVEFDNVAIDSVVENQNPAAPGTGAQAFSGGAELRGDRLAIWDAQSGALIASSGVVEVNGLYIDGVAVPDNFETAVRGAIRSDGESTLSVTGATLVDVEGPALQVDAEGRATVDGLSLAEISGPVVSADELGVAELSAVSGAASSRVVGRNGAAVRLEGADLSLVGSDAGVDATSASEVVFRDVQIEASAQLALTEGATLDASDLTFIGPTGVCLGSDSSLSRVALVTDGLALQVTGGVHALTDVELSSSEQAALEFGGSVMEVNRAYIGGRSVVTEGELTLRDSIVDSPGPALTVLGGAVWVVRVAVVASQLVRVEGGRLEDESGEFLVLDIQ
jgi:hypothetical protein